MSGQRSSSTAQPWRRRATRADLAPLEARAAGMMAPRGYGPSGPITAPGPLALLGLWTRNKSAVWRFGLRRFGARLFLGRKIARRLGLKALDASLGLQMDEITLRYLK
jgi:hypothetical protein